MAYSILLVFEKPDLSLHDNQRQWEGCAKNLEGLSRQNKDIELLGENCLLLRIPTSLQGISDIVRHSMDLPYKYAIFPEPIEWFQR